MNTRQVRWGTLKKEAITRGISLWTFRQWSEAGLLGGRAIGGTRKWYPADAVDKLLKEGHAPASTN